MKQPRPRDFQFCSEKSVNFQWIGRTSGARRAPRCRSCPQAAAPEARTIASWRGNCIVACDEGRPPGRRRARGHRGGYRFTHEQTHRLRARQGRALGGGDTCGLPQWAHKPISEKAIGSRGRQFGLRGRIIMQKMIHSVTSHVSREVFHANSARRAECVRDLSRSRLPSRSGHICGAQWPAAHGNGLDEPWRQFPGRVGRSSPAPRIKPGDTVMEVWHFLRRSAGMQFHGGHRMLVGRGTRVAPVSLAAIAHVCAFQRPQPC